MFIYALLTPSTHLNLHYISFSGFSNKLKADLIKELIKHDDETAMIDLEKEAMNEDVGECEQCEDLPNIKAVVKAHYKCNDCDLKICTR